MHNEKAIELLEKATSLILASLMWEDESMLEAQRLGLQGEKRKERYEGTKDYYAVKYLKCVAMDLFNVKLNITIHNLVFPKIDTFKEYFEICLQKNEEYYWELHKIANDLVINCYRPLAEVLYKRTDCLIQEQIKIKRMLKEGNAVNWNAHHIFTYELTGKNIHDEYEEKESKIGYNY